MPDTLKGHRIPDFLNLFKNIPMILSLNDMMFELSIFPNPSRKGFVTVDPSYKLYQVSL